MSLSEYYENLEFENGKKINVAKQMNMNVNNLLHWHPYEELLLSMSDHITASVNFIDYNLKAGDIIVINPGDLHLINCENNDDLLIIQFPQDMFTSFADLNRLFVIFSGNHYVAYDPKDTNSMRRVLLLKEIASLSDSPENFREVKIYSLLLNFFAELGSYWFSSGKADCAEMVGTEYDTTKFIAEICLYISENCAEHLTLEDVAKHAGVLCASGDDVPSSILSFS